MKRISMFSVAIVINISLIAVLLEVIIYHPSCFTPTTINKPVPHIGSVVKIEDPRSVYNNCVGELLPCEHTGMRKYGIRLIYCPKYDVTVNNNGIDGVVLENNELQYLKEIDYAGKK